MSYNTGTQSSGCLTYLIYNALKESVFLHCNIGIFSKYYVHRVFGLIRKNHWSMHSRSAVFLNNTKTPDFTFLGVKSGVHFTICWFSAFIAEREGVEPSWRNYWVQSMSSLYIHSLQRKPPSTPNAHHTKKLPNVIIFFRDLMKLNVLIHPTANW